MIWDSFDDVDITKYSDRAIVESVNVVALPDDAPFPSDEVMVKTLKEGGEEHNGLRLWGHEDGIVPKLGEPRPLDRCHWIAVRAQTCIHNDPTYGHYCHHLKLRCDPGTLIRGVNDWLAMHRGFYYVLDSHAPHQVISGGGWNLGVCLDSNRVLPLSEALPRMIKFAMTTQILAADPKKHWTPA